MKQTQAAGEGEMTDPVTLLGTTQPMAVVRPESGTNAPQPMGKQPSYHPTRWPQVNRLLDLADTLTGGHAKWVQRTFNYLLFGGFAALVNLVLITFIYKGVKLSVDRHVHYAIAFVLATEVSIIVNFIPQDLVTFRHLPGHSRSWLLRCLRFHMTAIGGILVTAAVSFSLHEVGLDITIAQAVAIIVALFFNFTFHHIFTYRHHAKPTVL